MSESGFQPETSAELEEELRSIVQRFRDVPAPRRFLLAAAVLPAAICVRHAG